MDIQNEYLWKLEVNGHTTWYINSMSIISQCILVSEVCRARDERHYCIGSRGSERLLVFLLFFFHINWVEWHEVEFVHRPSGMKSQLITSACGIQLSSTGLVSSCVWWGRVMFVGSSWHGSVACRPADVYSWAAFIPWQTVRLLLSCWSVVRVSVLTLC